MRQQPAHRAIEQRGGAGGATRSAGIAREWQEPDRPRTLRCPGDVSSAVAALAGHEGITLLSLAEHFLEFGLDDMACEAVARFSASPPHGSVATWLAGRGNLAA